MLIPKVFEILNAKTSREVCIISNYKIRSHMCFKYKLRNILRKIKVRANRLFCEPQITLLLQVIYSNRHIKSQVVK